MVLTRLLSNFGLLRGPFKAYGRNCHSRPLTFPQKDMKIRLLPAWSDNYMYLLICEKTKECAAVDPVEPEKILQAVKEEGAKLTAVLTTHHHSDHAGGNNDLVRMTGALPVYGGDNRIGALNHKVSHDDKFKIGDTLFLSGCGRMFEGNAQQMFHALVEVLGSLPDNTKVFCGHEYSVNGLKFGKTVEPNNKVLLDKLAWAEKQREQGLPTIPSTIGEEKLYNPFMRVREESVKKYAGESDPVSVLAAVRKAKDNFKG